MARDQGIDRAGKLRMTWIAGVDGCPAGWFRVSRETDTGHLDFQLLPDAASLIEAEPRPSLLAIDVPIGLPDTGSRQCDREARRCLRPPRASSVFPAPVRAALAAASRDEASAITSGIDGRRVGVQAWGIYRKIREVDDLLRISEPARNVIREVHPEVCFWAWAGHNPMGHSKRKPAGRAERLALVEAWLGPGVLEHARGSVTRGHLANDDILDACAALWTAHRILAGTARTLPTTPEIDAGGLPMQIVY